ncbi:MAG: DUF4412 domain-containing protein [Flavobacteriales bacterium]|nr:DUF4412 domain-containing protein [Flavobacteriales bacterium]
MRTLYLTLLALLASAASAQQCSFVLVSSQTNSSGDTRTDSITYSFDGPNVAMLMHGRGNQPDVRLVFDPAAGAITQLHTINGMKGGFVFAMSEKRWPGMTYSQDTPTGGKVKYTGKEKVIQGHTCKEMKVSGSEYSGTAWVAEDIPLSMLRVFSYQSVGAGKSTTEADNLKAMGMNGLPLEMTLKSTTGKADVQLLVLDYQPTVDASLFNTEGHSTTFVEE